MEKKPIPKWIVIGLLALLGGGSEFRLSHEFPGLVVSWHRPRSYGADVERCTVFLELIQQVFNYLTRK